MGSNKASQNFDKTWTRPEKDTNDLFLPSCSDDQTLAWQDQELGEWRIPSLPKCPHHQFSLTPGRSGSKGLKQIGRAHV